MAWLAEMTKAVDYGIVSVSVNGTAAAKTIDLFAPEVKHERFDLGVFDLKEGANRLAIAIAGANDAAIKRHMVGLDYVLLKAE